MSAKNGSAPLIDTSDLVLDFSPAPSVKPAPVALAEAPEEEIIDLFDEDIIMDEPEPAIRPPVRPVIRGRPIQERTRSSRGGNKPPRNPRAPCEMLYQRALESIAAGNYRAAVQDLKLALVYAPGEKRFIQAIERAERRAGRS